MTAMHRRRCAVQRILGEIEFGVDRGDRIAALIRIREAQQFGEITGRDANRLTELLLGVLGGPLEGLRRLVHR